MERARQVEFDNKVLEKLVHHPSLWLTGLAACVLDARMSETERFDTCKRMLQSDQIKTLHIAAKMAGRLPDYKGHKLILARLRGTDVRTSCLFEQLAEDKFPIECSHRHILKWGLISSSAKMAESAARWCGTSAKVSEAWLRQLLRQAFDHWTTIDEESCLENEDVVPNGPRKELYRVLRAIDNFEFNELVKLAVDIRHDVSELAIQDIVDRVFGSDDDRNQLVDELCAKRFPSACCAKLLDAKIPYSQDNLTALCSLLGDVNPGYRRVAIRVLSHPNMDRVEALRLATQMKDDADSTVRDAAYKCLDTLQADPLTATE